MKHYKTVDVPATTAEEWVETTCDLCGVITYSEEMNSIHDTERTYQDTYVESFFRNKTERGATEFDICYNCFEGKLVPWLLSQGAHPKVERKPRDE